MEAPLHSMSNLFAQLGLPTELATIESFIAAHSPLAPDVQLAEAAFWSTSQAEFLRESMLADADWAEVIDTLNEELRAK